MVKKKRKRRQLEICVISDTHLGTHGCRAGELLHYLKSINPELLILNGDIIDVWNFKKNFFPETHKEVIRELIRFTETDTKVIYITGNHDEVFRKYSDFRLGNFHLVDKYIFQAGGKLHWAFHGDVFDATTKGYAKIIAKLGGKGYDLLILFNRLLNEFLEFMGRDKMSLSRKIKNSVKQAVKYIDNFEKTAAELAIDEGYDYVICGHIHQPKVETVTTEEGSVKYLNSGDWIENMTALEYNDGLWSVHQEEYIESRAINRELERSRTKKEEKSISELFNLITSRA